MRPDQLAEALREIEARGLYRLRRVLDSAKACEVSLDGRVLLNFSSNDYLGLSRHPEVLAAFQRGASVYGVGSAASHLVSGHGPSHHALEEELAEFCGRERALLFSTGYMANLGIVAALAGRGDWVFEDRLNHASLLDGAQLSGAKLKRYAHVDTGGLRAELAACPVPGRLLATDGVFSMDGDIAPLAELVNVASEAKAWLMLDDAHGIGVVGPGGRGVSAQHGLDAASVPVLMGTLGKALGVFGAFVAGSDDLIEYLIQRARTYIYTTALPPAVAEAARASLRLIDREAWRREKLQALIQRFRAGAKQIGLRLLPSQTPIQPLLVGDNDRVLQASQKLLDKGFLVIAIRPPTVPVGTARLRVALSAAHDESQVDRLLDALESSVSRT